MSRGNSELFNFVVGIFIDDDRTIVQILFNIIHSYRLDGLELGVVDIGDSEKPRSIAVHSMKRLLFWTDVGNQQSIYRARVDGADRLTLAFKLDGIAAIAIDQDLDLLFFAYNKRIDVMDIDGRNRYGRFEIQF